MDYGQTRIGVAYSPGDAAIAIPLETIRAKPLARALRQIAKLTEDKRAVEIVVGLPRHLSGQEGASAQAARQFAESLATLLPKIRVCLVDERRSTLSAKALLHERGVAERDQRKMVDSVAAQVILEQALELERFTGVPPGETVKGEDARGEDVNG